MEEKVLAQCPTSQVLYADSIISGYTMAKCGFGVAIMPDFVCTNDPELCSVPMNIEDTISYGIVWNNQDNRKETRDLVQIIKEVYSSD